MMSGFLEAIKLNVFKVLKNPYKKKLFKDIEADIELMLLSELLAKEQLLFIDVGANRGEFIYIAKKVLSPSKIWAFEPLSYFAKKLKALFPEITVFNLGLSDIETPTTLYVPINNGIPDDSLSSVNKPNGDFNSYKINCVTLDSIIEKNHVTDEKIILKIDVEGHELKVLKGAEKTINNLVLVMLIEIEERHHDGKSLKEMIENIESKGFGCYYLHPENPELVEYSANAKFFQRKEDINTRRYINNFWFFSKQIDYLTLVSKLNSSI
jgi:FkbM family methyltransferase